MSEQESLQTEAADQQTETAAESVDSGRRTFMQALTVGAAGLGVAAMSGNAAAAEEETSEPFEVGGDALNLGGTLVVGDGGYDTITQAWDAASSGDTIYVHCSYDAKEAGEPFPVVLDYEEKEVMLTGGHPSGSVIDASHSSENVIEVLGRGMNDYRNNPVVQNLKIVGGDVGLRVRAAPFASFENLVVYRAGSHGVHVQGYTDPDSSREKGTFGALFHNCQTWVCGGDGFRMAVDAMPHGTTFHSCKASSNEGVGFRIRGYVNEIVGCTSQLNHSYGVEARRGKGSHIEGSYIEANGRANSYPIDVYAKNADGLNIHNCYFNGITPRSTAHNHDYVLRAINVHDTDRLSVNNCTFRNYGEGVIATFGCVDPDFHASSHYTLDTGRGLFATDPTNFDNVRPRTDGMIMPSDLRGVDGDHEGDTGYHIGGGVEGPAVWREGEWRISETTSL
ncbi:right-handed parallel beta-helix repeat-containing protein [Haloarcula nitratireducens]|uniref:Right-handed parallel beta-helix repeat-containing protein n=1 Tax=Haloarcula nitratireducens TaxID=2487749 RepID=A0AAW4PD78_9EURY|nr:right-handed parallel beta-helix repeat-containing protein [Halomicroarcula nitratireducens]MBX0295763.1 right-handed parallel beta-helix repeat-containing protein [Halomicroarcula nitratireducens]